MAGRRRTQKKRYFPPNLYESGGYYRWRNPMDGQWHSIGRDRAQAIAEAVEANLHIQGLLQKRRLVDRVAGIDGDTVAEWCAKYRVKLQEKLDGEEIARSTHDSYKQKAAMVETAWGSLKINAITTRNAAEFLARWEDAGKKRMAQAMRSFLIDFFNAAMAAGWAASNPVVPTKAPRVKVTRERLTLEAFLAIHQVAVEHFHPWVARSMELALVTGQRREEIRELGPGNVRDGKLWVVPGKTEKHGTRICIPLDLRLQAVNWSVGEVISRCKDYILSRHFIHHAARVGRSKPGDPIRKQTISGMFADARDKSGLTWAGDPPTFHEIRSLAARLYAKERGDDFAQALLGHKTAKCAALYRDSRGAEWIEIRT